MNNKPIAPVLIGRGMAGQAIMKSLAIVSQIDPELYLQPVRLARRGDPLKSYISNDAICVLFIANPSGLHAQAILEGAAGNFHAIAADKPACVRAEEIPPLLNVKVPVTVFHGYRAMWGTKTIKELATSGRLGEVFSFEARYWQSSSAQAALSGIPEKRTWKNDPNLNGPFDTLIDLGCHVVDICLFLLAATPLRSNCWISYQNSAGSHRDTHVHLMLQFPEHRRALASISKTVHGAANNFEYTLIGTKGSATWRFLQPDEVEFGSGNQTSILRRQSASESSGSYPFHGLGWLEGYVEITRQTLRAAAGLTSLPVPTLQESLAAMRVLLSAR
jgi:predicted dehydrogenase